MADPASRPVFTAQAFAGLHAVRQSILEGATGKVRGALLQATARAAVQLARNEAVPAEVLSRQVCELVAASLAALVHRDWKPDTALRLARRRGDSRV